MVLALKVVTGLPPFRAVKGTWIVVGVEVVGAVTV